MVESKLTEEETFLKVKKDIGKSLTQIKKGCTR